MQNVKIGADVNAKEANPNTVSRLWNYFNSTKPISIY